VKILVADEHRLPRGALCQILNREPDFEVVGEADSGGSTIQAAIETRPDIVLLGIELNIDNAQHTVNELLEADPALSIIILCIQIEPVRVKRMLDLGVRAYLHKSISVELLKSTIRDLAGGARQTMMLSLPVQGGGDLPEFVVDGAPRREPAYLARARAPAEGFLSDRELQVLACVAEAMTNRQIAARLTITEGTVKRHLRNIFNKLGATSRIDAVNKGLDTPSRDLPRQRREF
jgi:DNA-binding NarL/FixJ family response regulator